MSAALGPAAVAVPVGWASDAGASLARRWFRRFRRADDLSRLVREAGSAVGLSKAEFDSVRALLEDPGTWRLLGSGSVEDLVARIASCLATGGDRTAEDSRLAGLAIARGLLEFAVWDLQPKVFQRVLLARLERMESGQAARLDQLLFGLHADLADEFASLQDRIERVLDRLPPGAAGRDEIEVYLRALIRWLNADPWPRHRQFGGPVLTPAAIERKLRVSVDGEAHGPDLDADQLAARCRRLVILGGPGSGKTWLARRTARCCAEQALRVMQAGRALEDIELPLFTTCSALLGIVGDIRQAAVSSALNQLGDLGGSRVSAALQALFVERNAGVLLVLDALDEAGGSGERIRQADTLPWRVVLTSRPSSWNGQLVIDVGTGVHRVGVLQPLSYPDDVEPFIHQWFSQQPGRSGDLVGQIARRPDLQKAATVPLILAFYCIIGAEQPLPQFRRDLYTRVLRRVLTGRWRGDEVSSPDLDLCLGRLRDWAWSDATADPVSGLGRWADTFLVAAPRLGGSADSALDHIAMPLGPPDPDTGRIERRFIHRTVREHLVAEHVARLPVDLAAAKLLPHLWYDPDWEYTAPAALVMHGEHDQLLRRLICLAARSDDVPRDLSIIDADWEFRGFLARVAAESSEADWSRETARIIGQARVELATAGRTGDLSRALSWPTSNGQIREALLKLLAAHKDDFLTVSQVARMVAELVPTAPERAQLREALLGLLASHRDEPLTIREIARMVAELVPTAQERAQLREALLGLLVGHSDEPLIIRELARMAAELDPTAQERAQLREALLGLLASHSDDMAGTLAGMVAGLAETVQERAQVREALLGVLAAYDQPWVAEPLAQAVVGLAQTAQERAQAREALFGLIVDRPLTADELVDVVAGLAQSAQERAQLQAALLELLVAHRDEPLTVGVLARMVAAVAMTPEERAKVREALLELLADSRLILDELVEVVAGLDPTAQERAQLREALMRALAAPHDDLWTAGAQAGVLAQLAETPAEQTQLREALLRLAAESDDMAISLAEVVAALDPTARERAQLREALFRVLAAHSNEVAGTLAGLARTSEERAQVREALLLAFAQDRPTIDEALAGIAARLAEAPEERAQVRDALLRLLASQENPDTVRAVAGVMAQLDPTAHERAQLRAALLRLLAARRNPYMPDDLVGLVVGLAPTAQEQAQLRAALFELVDAYRNEPSTINQLTLMVAELDPTTLERAQLRAVLLGLLARRNPYIADGLVGLVVGLAPTAQERAKLRAELFGLLAVDEDPDMVGTLAEVVAELDPTTQERTRLWKILLRKLAAAQINNPLTVGPLAQLAVELAATPEERTKVREALLGLLPARDQLGIHTTPASTTTRLHPTAGPVGNWYSWSFSPRTELLAVIRQDSGLTDWLALLPSLRSLSS
jgi:hypothetical protein